MMETAMHSPRSRLAHFVQGTRQSETSSLAETGPVQVTASARKCRQNRAIDTHGRRKACVENLLKHFRPPMTA